MSNPDNNLDDDWGEILDSDDPVDIRSIRSIQSNDPKSTNPNNHMISYEELKHSIDMFDITQSSDLMILKYLGTFLKSVKFIFSQNELNGIEISILDQIFESIEHMCKFYMCKFYMCKFFYNNNSHCYSNHYEYMRYIRI